SAAPGSELDAGTGVVDLRSRGGDPATTERLLDAAIALFAEKGFDGAGVAGIARRAGVTTGAIYSRWSGKTEMFLDALDLVMTAHLTELLAGGRALGAAEVLASLGADLLVDRPHDEQRRAVVVEAFAVARRDPEFAALMRRRLAQQEARLAAVVEAGHADGLIDPALSTEAIVTLCHAIGLGFVLLRSLDRPLPGADEWNTLVGRLIAAALPPGAAPNPDPAGA
ncbi:MAG: TetR/AcrR family transcriptional regulator, partial [Actinomyces sp.]